MIDNLDCHQNKCKLVRLLIKVNRNIAVKHGINYRGCANTWNVFTYIYTCLFFFYKASKVEWTKAGKVVKPSKFFKMMSEDNTHTMKITQVFPEDEGVYTCVISNAAGKVRTMTYF